MCEEMDKKSLSILILKILLLKNKLNFCTLNWLMGWLERAGNMGLPRSHHIMAKVTGAQLWNIRDG